MPTDEEPQDAGQPAEPATESASAGANTTPAVGSTASGEDAPEAGVSEPKSDYNQGSETDRRSALAAIDDFTKLLITLATGTVALSATFLSQFYRGRDLTLLVLAWLSLGVSILAGSLAHGSRISQLAESRIKPRRSALEGLNLLQWLLLLGGGAAFGVFVISNVTAKPNVELTTDRVAVSASGHGSLGVFCGTGDGGSCAMTLGTAYIVGGRNVDQGEERARVSADADTQIPLILPQPVWRALRSDSRVSARVTLQAVADFGQPANIHSTVELGLTGARSPSCLRARCKRGRSHRERRATAG